MKILITGNKGFIGKYLSRRFGDEEVIGIDIKDGKNILDCTFPKVDLVYHLAGQTRVMESINNPHNDALNNILGTIQVAKAYPKTRIIYSASGGTSIDIKSPYGLSKHTAGEYIKLLCKNYVICNLPNVFNKDDGRVLSIWLKEKIINLYGGKQTRDFVHINDIVDGLIMAQKWPTGEYYLGSNTETPLIDIATALHKQIIIHKARKGECLRSKVPNTTPNWKPKLSILEYIWQLQS